MYHSAHVFHSCLLILVWEVTNQFIYLKNGYTIWNNENVVNIMELGCCVLFLPDVMVYNYLANWLGRLFFEFETSYPSISLILPFTCIKYLGIYVQIHIYLFKWCGSIGYSSASYIERLIYILTFIENLRHLNVWSTRSSYYGSAIETNIPFHLQMILHHSS